jgi:tape measure domain-containing protein
MVADLAVNISANIKDLQRNIGKAKATLKNFGSTATSIGTGLTASLTLPIASLGGVALKTASDFEQLEVRLQTLTGSAKAGRKQFELLQKFSAGTPFQLQDLVKANNTLLGFGLSAEDSFTALQQLGDVASATGADLQSIAVAFGQSSAEGKLFTRDIRQFINQGVPAVDLLAESMGVARSEVFTLAEEGKISFKVLQDAISQATSAGGKFAGATKAQSQTIAGLFSTLRDNVSLALGELGKELVRAFNLDKLVTDLTNKIKAITIVFKALSSDVKKRMFIVAGVLGASGPVLIAIGLLIKAITAISLPVIAVIAVISTGVAYVFKSAFDEMGSVSGAFELIFKTMVNGVLDAVSAMVTGLVRQFPLLAKSIIGVSQSVQDLKFDLPTKEEFTPIGDAITFLKNTFGEMSDVFQRVKLQMSEGFQITVDAPDTSSFKDILYNDIERPLEDLKVKVAELPKVSKTEFETFASNIKSIGGQLKDFLANEIGGAFVKLGDTIGRSLSGADDSMATAFEKIILIVLDFAKSLAMLAGGIGGVMLFIPGLQGTGIALLAAATALSAIAGGFTAGIQKRIGNREARAEESMRAMAGSSVPDQSMMNLSGEFRVKGTDLVLSLAEANYSLGR